MTTNTPSYTLMTRQAPLQGFCRDLEKESAIAVDLEADSLFHYQEKVCLIQISTPRQNVVLDPLSLKDLSPLAPVLSNPRIRKVFHGADYDIRSLYRDFEIDVNGLFDTEIAARFLGINRHRFFGDYITAQIHSTCYVDMMGCIHRGDDDGIWLCVGDHLVKVISLIGWAGGMVEFVLQLLVVPVHAGLVVVT